VPIDSSEGSTTMEQREFRLFRTLVHEHTGIWLRDNKHIMLAARLSRRLRQLGIPSFAQYYEYLQNVRDNGEEITHMINCVTTNKTSFFRERHHFDYLSSTIVPQIRASGPRPVRIWSAASSTGEEAYSIVITLLEALQANRAAVVPPSGRRTLPVSLAGPWRFEVVASDIDTQVLEKARRAIYDASTLTAVSHPLLEKYFLRGRDDMRGYVKVKPEVAQRVNFRRINLMDDKWELEGRFDVIFFRNALIYFKQETQDIFLRHMVRYLKPRGYLFLGNAEHIPWLHPILEPLQNTMYRLRDLSGSDGLS